MATLKQTKEYELFEGDGPARGCFGVERKADRLTTDWNTGNEGAEWAEELQRMSDSDFDTICSGLIFS